MEILNKKHHFEEEQSEQINYDEIGNKFVAMISNIQEQKLPQDSLRYQAQQLYIKALSSLALIYSFSSQIQKAIACFIRLLVLVGQKQKIRKIIMENFIIILGIQNDVRKIVENKFQWQFLLQSIEKYQFLLELIRDSSSAEYLSVYAQTGYFCRQLGYEEKGLKYFLKALETIDKYQLKHKKRQFELSIAVGQVYRNKKEYDIALKYFFSALKIIQQKETSQPMKEWGRAKLQIATTYNWAGNEQDQQKCIKQCQNRASESKPKAEIWRAIPLNRLLQIYKRQQKDQKARQVYKQILQLQSLTQGELTDQKNDLLEILSSAHQQMQRYQDAIKAMKKSIEFIRQSQNRLKFLSLSSNLKQIGLLYYKLKKYDEALQYYQQALTQNLNHKGEQCVNVAQIRNSIADMHYFLNNYPQAIKEYIKALKIRQKIDQEEGIVSYEHANLFESIAFAYDKNQSYQKALDYYKKALEIIKFVPITGREEEIKRDKKWINQQVDKIYETLVTHSS